MKWLCDPRGSYSIPGNIVSYIGVGPIAVWCEFSHLSSFRCMRETRFVIIFLMHAAVIQF